MQREYSDIGIVGAGSQSFFVLTRNVPFMTGLMSRSITHQDHDSGSIVTPCGIVDSIVDTGEQIFIEHHRVNLGFSHTLHGLNKIIHILESRSEILSYIFQTFNSCRITITPNTEGNLFLKIFLTGDFL